MNTLKELFERSLQEFDNGNIDKSKELAEKVIFLYDATEGYYVLGLIYAVQEQWEKTIINCHKVFEVAPNIVDNLNRLGVSYCQLGNIRKGLSFFSLGRDLGDEHCIENYNYWIKKI